MDDNEIINSVLARLDDQAMSEEYTDADFVEGCDPEALVLVITALRAERDEARSESGSKLRQMDIASARRTWEIAKTTGKGTAEGGDLDALKFISAIYRS